MIGDNGKALIFPLADLPEMPRGKGVKLQSYREGGLGDGLVFSAEEGASWIDGAGRTRVWAGLAGVAGPARRRRPLGAQGIPRQSALPAELSEDKAS